MYLAYPKWQSNVLIVLGPTSNFSSLKTPSYVMCESGGRTPVLTHEENPRVLMAPIIFIIFLKGLVKNLIDLNTNPDK